MQQRYYDPVAGRFLSVDPVMTDAGNGALFNRYMYAASNPYTLIDPDGRCTGSRITNSDGTCKSTGGFTTGIDGMAQGMAIQRAVDNLASGGYGQLAAQSVASGETIKVAGYVLAGTAYGVANVLTVGQGARVAGLARSFLAERAGAPSAAFHHTGTVYVDSILRSGLRPGSYATPTPGLSPLQAHIELSLSPAGGARNAVIQIDLAGLRAAGYQIPSVSRVSGQFGMAGGGFEMRFPYAVPPEFMKAIPR
jgi:hypothetical protein